MNVRGLLVLLALAVVAPATMRAQPPGNPVADETLAQARPASQRQMYEDIEIMRRLLNRAFNQPWKTSALTTLYPANLLDTPTGFYGAYQPLAPFSGANVNTPTLYSAPSVGLTTQSPGADGVYLKGHGVVFTLRVPKPASGVKPPTPAASQPAMSEWERTRKQLRGEKVEAEVIVATATAPSIEDKLVQLLIENGQNFSQLHENELITIVVTLVNPGNVATTTSSTGTSTSTTGSPARSYPSGRGGPTIDATGGTSDPNIARTPATVLGVAATTQQAAGEYELLGDLHIKQGRAQEAIKAYKQGLEKTKDSEKTAVLYRKLAQAYLQVEEVDAAALQKAFADYAGAVDRLKKQPTGSGGVRSQSHNLPDKLIISAQKSTLDEAGRRKMTVAEFKKVAAIEHVSFPRATKPDATKRVK